jgi:hypothetical protein
VADDRRGALKTLSLVKAAHFPRDREQYVA